MAQWTAVDFDGTLAHYSAGQSGLGSPIPAMVERVKAWIAEGKEVRIFTARVAPDNGAEFIAEQTQIIGNWCQDHLGCRLAVTAIKDFGMIELYDDRAFHVEMNTGRLTDSPTVALPAARAGYFESSGGAFRANADGVISNSHVILAIMEPIPAGYRLLLAREPIPNGSLFWHKRAKRWESLEPRGLLAPTHEYVIAPIKLTVRPAPAPGPSA